MNYTQTYHLPQWEETDRVLMTDFNQMCRDMESGMEQNAAATAAAQATADTARTEAAEAAKLPYVVGTYRGTGISMSINVGFRPSAVLISGEVRTAYTNAEALAEYGHYSALLVDGVTSIGRMTDTGFSFTGGPDFPMLSAYDRIFVYIAFR